MDANTIFQHELRQIDARNVVGHRTADVGIVTDENRMRRSLSDLDARKLALRSCIEYAYRLRCSQSAPKGVLKA